MSLGFTDKKRIGMMCFSKKSRTSRPGNLQLIHKKMKQKTRRPKGILPEKNVMKL